MPPASGSALVRAALVVPVILLVVFAGLLGYVRLLSDRERRKYVMSLTQLMLDTTGAPMRGTSPRCTALFAVGDCVGVAGAEARAMSARERLRPVLLPELGYGRRPDQ